MTTRRSAAPIGLIVVVALAVVPAAGWAQDCDRNAPQIDLNVCAGQAFKRSDAALNTAYKQIMARLKDDAKARQLLTTAQKAWLGYRGAECAFASSDNVGGSIHPMIVLQCEDGLTKARTAALTAYLNCQEGDMACPVPAP